MVLVMQVVLVVLATATTVAMLVLARKHVTRQTFELACQVNALTASRESVLEANRGLTEAYRMLELELEGTSRELISLASTISSCESYAYCVHCKQDAYAVRKKYLGANERGGPFCAGPGDDCIDDQELNGQPIAHVWAWVALSEESGCDGCGDRYITAPDHRCGYCRAGFVECLDGATERSDRLDALVDVAGM